MSYLHAYWALKNQQAFQRLLDASSQQSNGASGGRSWTKFSPLGGPVDVNARDWLGRTALHLTCSSSEPYSLECTRSLLASPTIQINIRDTESQYTALHRALYNGNIPAALLLLHRSDVDTTLKDSEGYTPFDLYNSTVYGTKPTKENTAQLFTWGVNRNAALGLGDGDDRVHPEEVRVQPIVVPTKSTDRMRPVQFLQVAMSKLHTAVVTSETSGNLRVCGFASGGRIGPGQHAQYSLKPLALFSQTITQVSLGQDHTLALTASGEVLSWGFNRFAQLGYTVEAAFGGVMGWGLDEIMMQPTPRKVHSALKKERVVGVAAGKTCSVCWTAEELFSWGTNNGQLGYDKSAQAVQVTPRKVTKITLPVLGVAVTDTAMACLLDNHDVVCLWNDRHFKISFTANTFPSDIKVSTNRRDIITKLTSCDETFAALSSSGELFTWTIPAENKVAIKPQRVWALRKQFSEVTDVALGADGSIIVCTQSGHVHVRSRTSKSGQGKAFKFQRVPYIQRVVGVCANNTGAFGILRTDYKPQLVEVKGNSIGMDLGQVLPFWELPAGKQPPVIELEQGGEDEEDGSVQIDIQRLNFLCEILLQENSKGGPSHGADLNVKLQSGQGIPAHRLILASRCAALRTVLGGGSLLEGRITFAGSDISFTGYDPLAVMILLYYLYTDELLALWDRRVFSVLERRIVLVGSSVSRVKSDLRSLARALDIPPLSKALESPSKRATEPSVMGSMQRLFWDCQQGKRERTSPLAADVVLQLGDKDVHCHSVILRARSDLFGGFFDDEDWTKRRWDEDGIIRVNVKHLSWRAMVFVLKWVYGEEALFDDLNHIETADEALELVFDVMAAANELLLDQVVLICSSFILQHLNINNASYVLTDATHLHASALVERVQSYMTANLETLLESRMLEDLSQDLVKQLAVYIRTQQAIKSPATRGNLFVMAAMEKHVNWLALQDIPQPSVPRTGKSAYKQSPRMSPTISTTRLAHQPSFTMSPVLTPHSASPRSAGDIFSMDDDSLPTLSLDQPCVAEKERSGPVWKASSSDLKVDMKTLLAEAAIGTNTEQRADAVPVKFSQRTPQRERKKLQLAPDIPATPSSIVRATSSPWKVSTPPTAISLAAPLPPVKNTPPTQSPGMLRKASTPSSMSKATPHAASPGMGPIFTPTRQQTPSQAGPSTPRRVSSNSAANRAWAAPPVQPVVIPTSSSKPSSFAAIQALQQNDVVPVIDKRSLLEIQQEEQARRAEDESVQAEIDFMIWWQAEEDRVKAEANGRSGASKSSVSKQRKPRGKKGDPPQVQSAPTRQHKPRPSPQPLAT